MVSWGIVENVDLPWDYPYSRVLDEIARADYAGTELGSYGFLPTEPGELRRELQKSGLTFCSAFVAMDLANASKYEAGLSHVERSAKLISAAGARLLILSDAITPERSATAGRPAEANRLSWNTLEWSAAVKAIREVVARCKAVGLSVAFHHHAGTHVETPEEVDRLFSMLSPDELGLCFDTGHYVYGGGHAVAFLARRVSRVRCVHLKDVDGANLEKARGERLDFHAAVRQGVFVPLGKAILDFSRILALLKERKFDGWVVVEADVLPGGRGADAPLASAVAGRKFLRRFGI